MVLRQVAYRFNHENVCSAADMFVLAVALARFRCTIVNRRGDAFLGMPARMEFVNDVLLDPFESRCALGLLE